MSAAGGNPWTRPESAGFRYRPYTCQAQYQRRGYRLKRSVVKNTIGEFGVADGSRTRHLRSHNPVLYLMSYGHRRKMLKNEIANFCL